MNSIRYRVEYQETGTPVSTSGQATPPQTAQRESAEIAPKAQSTLAFPPTILVSHESPPLVERRSFGEMGLTLTMRARTILKASREEANVPQQELADRLGWTRNMVANLESGRRDLRFHEFVLISLALNVEPERVLRRIFLW